MPLARFFSAAERGLGDIRAQHFGNRPLQEQQGAVASSPEKSTLESMRGALMILEIPFATGLSTA